MSTQKRPLVVLAGWMGCRVQQLKHYEALYQSMGFDTLPLVVSTLAVIDRSLQQCPRPIRPPRSGNWTSRQQQQHQQTLKNNSTVQDWAWHTLQMIHAQQPPFYIFHVFSNGGCFLWETVCRILEKLDMEGAPKDLLSLSANCSGVIFDSCPVWMGYNPTGLWKALHLCPVEDRQQATHLYGEERLQRVDTRQCNQEFFDFLTTNALDVPQLYLYSHSDVLSDANHIATLVKDRQKHQSHAVLEEVWTESSHCAHLRDHPEAYRAAVANFVQVVTKQQSKL